MSDKIIKHNSCVKCYKNYTHNTITSDISFVKIKCYKLEYELPNHFCKKCLEDASCITCKYLLHNKIFSKGCITYEESIELKKLFDKSYSDFLKETVLTELYYNNKYNIFICEHCSKTLSEPEFYNSSNDISVFDYDEIHMYNPYPDKHDYNVKFVNK